MKHILFIFTIIIYGVIPQEFGNDYIIEFSQELSYGDIQELENRFNLKFFKVLEDNKKIYQVRNLNENTKRGLFYIGSRIFKFFMSRKCEYIAY